MAPQEAQGTRQLTEPLPPPMPTGSSFCSPSGTTSASAHSTSALRGLPAYQPDLSNILSIKSKREGSLRGGDEKVFVFYSGTIFFFKSILTPRGVGLELQTDLDTSNLMHPQTSLLYPFLHILSIKSNSGGFPKGGHRFPLCFP